MRNMRKLLKINVAFKKKTFTRKKINSQDVFHNICRVRDSEHNKKETLFKLQNCRTYNRFKNCSKVTFSLIDSFSTDQITKILR